jgi:hypothetical protein
MNSYILVDRPFMMLIPGRAYSCPQNAVVKLPVGVKLVMNYNCGFVVEASHRGLGWQESMWRNMDKVLIVGLHKFNIS